jgi:hypothetical protein
LTTHYLLPETTDKLLRAFICEKEKGQFKKGMLMEYVNRAVLHYIVNEKGHSTHTHFVKVDATKQLKERVEKWLIQKGYDPSLKTVSDSHLKEAIRTIEGVRDSRTVKNRIEALLTCGVKRVVNFDKPTQYDFEAELWQESMK